MTDSEIHANGTVALPQSSDVVIIGAGIIGVAAALFLAERGISVTVCEKGTVGCEQSTRNWGWVRRMGRDPVEIPLAIESARLWESMNSRIGAETGFRKTGIFYLCKTAKDVAKYEAWLEQAKTHKLDSIMLPASKIADYLPGLSEAWSGALFTPSDARAEPSLATSAIAREVRRRGISIIEHCAVRGIDRSAGRVSGAVTERGAIACSQIVVATGAWTRLFCGNLGIDFPQLKVLGSVMRTGPVAGAPDYAVAGKDFAFRKRLDGGYTIAQKNANIAQIVPDSFRLLRRFLPAFRSEGNEIQLRFGKNLFRRVPPTEAVVAVGCDAVRAMPRAGSEAVNNDPAARLAESRWEFRSIFWRTDSGELGLRHRCHARCDPCDFSCT